MKYFSNEAKDAVQIVIGLIFLFADITFSFGGSFKINIAPAIGIFILFPFIVDIVRKYL